MSRAFVNEDAEGPEPIYTLPDRDDPGYDEAAALALIDGWNRGDVRSAALATGYAWGEPKLVPHVQQILEQAEALDDDRTGQLARRFIRTAERLKKLS